MGGACSTHNEEKHKEVVDWIIVHDEETCNLYSLCSIIRSMKLR